MKRENIKIGMKVRIRKWDDMANEYKIDSAGDIEISSKNTCFVQDMKHLCGRVATVKDCNNYGVELDFEDNSGDTNWDFVHEMIEPVYETLKSRLKNKTIVELRDGSICILVDDKLIDIKNGETLYIASLNDDLTFSEDKDLDIMKFNDWPYGALTDKQWTWKREESILDEAEKKYLSDVVRPFKKDIRCILLRKTDIVAYGNNDTYMQINMNNGDMLSLPYFKFGTMYKGMEANKGYTLKELGL